MNKTEVSLEDRSIAERVTIDELVEITRTLIRTPSPNPPADVRECAKAIAGLFKKEGIPVEIEPVSGGLCNVIATLEGSGPGKTLWYNGHMDVVPAGADWTRDPWGAELVDGKIYGRGASDMKGGLASMMGSMFALKRAGCPFHGEIVFTAVADEETGSENGTIRLIQEKRVAADYAIVGEPNDGWIAIGNRGALWLQVEITGKSSHASRPDLGVNAIENAARAVDALSKLELSARQDVFLVPTGSLAVTLIDGGTKVNMTPDRCTISMDRRMLPIETVDEAIEQVRRAIAGAIQKEASFDIRVIKSWPPILMDTNHPLVRTVARAFEQVFGRPAELRGKAASTDASYIYGTAGIPVVLYGPGTPSQAHVADEYLEVDSLPRASHIYTLTALSLLRAGGSLG